MFCSIVSFTLILVASFTFYGFYSVIFFYSSPSKAYLGVGEIDLLRQSTIVGAGFSGIYLRRGRS